MDTLLAVAKGIDRISWFFGILAAVAVLAASLLGAFDALVSYGITWLDSLDIWLRGAGLEVGYLLNWYRGNANSFADTLLILFAVMVMLGAPWTLKVNEHVRVDLVFSMLGARGRVWVDLLGGLIFLLPICFIMIWFTLPWFIESWNSGEMGINAGGLPRWPSKLLLPVGFALVALQGIAEIIKCIAALTHGVPREHTYEKPVQ